MATQEDQDDRETQCDRAALNAALSELQEQITVLHRECDTLIAAIPRAIDLEIEFAAGDAIATWIVASEAAHRAGMHLAPSSAIASVARLAVSIGRELVAGLIERAWLDAIHRRAIGLPNALQRLRSQLAQPPESVAQGSPELRAAWLPRNAQRRTGHGPA